MTCPPPSLEGIANAQYHPRARSIIQDLFDLLPSAGTTVVTSFFPKTLFGINSNSKIHMVLMQLLQSAVASLV